MHTSKEGLPVERMDGYEGRMTQLGEVSLRAAFGQWC
jgi:hypothetical protein